MPEIWKFIVDHPASVAALVAIATAVLGLMTAWLQYLQRRKEHRWRQAEMGKKLIDGMFADKDAHNGLLAFDGQFSAVNLEKWRNAITPDDIRLALKPLQEEASPEITALQVCFDAIFYHIDRIEHSIGIGLIRFEDVLSPFDYYSSVLAVYKVENCCYLEHISYPRVLSFLERFESWRTPKLREADENFVPAEEVPDQSPISSEARPA